MLDNAIEGTVGVSQELAFSDPLDERTKAQKIGLGLSRISVIPSFVQFFRKYPELDYAEGQTFATPLPRQMWQAVIHEAQLQKSEQTIVPAVK